MDDKVTRFENYVSLALRGVGDIPPFIAEVSRVTDRQTALQFYEFFAGKSVYIPHCIKSDDSNIVHAVGRDAADVICQNFGGCPENIPMGPWRGHGRKWMKILNMLQESKSIRSIANDTGLSQRSIYTCKKRLTQMGFHFKSYQSVALKLKREKEDVLYQQILTGRRNGMNNMALAKMLCISTVLVSKLIVKLRDNGVDVHMLRGNQIRCRNAVKALPPG